MKTLFSTLLVLLISCATFAQVQTGKASFYAKKFEGRMTASGETYDPNKLTAAHRHLPFGTKVRVTNLANNKTVTVKINDRGPFVSGRIIDLSRSAADKLNFITSGTTDVVVKTIDGKTSEPRDLAKTKALPKSSTPKPKKVESSQKNTSAGSKGSSDSSAETPSRNLETEFYDFNVNQFKAEGFGVQIGSFQEAANLIRLADNLKASFQKKITVQIKTVENTKIYSLIIGKYPTRKKAERLEKRIGKEYPDCFVVNFSESGNKD